MKKKGLQQALCDFLPQRVQKLWVQKILAVHCVEPCGDLYFTYIDVIMRLTPKIGSRKAEEKLSFHNGKILLTINRIGENI